MSNFNNTGEVKEISILDMMNGAIGERTAYELTRIMKNCRDFNTEAKKARTLTIKLSIVENSAYRLANSIKKTQMRATALKNITIPHYTELSKSISDALEEKEREEFTRLKVIKRNKGE